jgi:hypothetical protein
LEHPGGTTYAKAARSLALFPSKANTGAYHPMIRFFIYNYHWSLYDSCIYVIGINVRVFAL